MHDKRFYKISSSAGYLRYTERFCLISKELRLLRHRAAIWFELKLQMPITIIVSEETGDVISSSRGPY